MKRAEWKMFLVVGLVAWSAMATQGARNDEVTLLMVPREEDAVRLGVDMASRYPTLLISYKLGANHSVSMHGWTGSEWVNVTLDDFLAGDFFRQGPASAVIVERNGITVPEKMIPPSNWCASVAKITTTELRPLIHLLGQYYDVPFKDWKWLTERYNMELDEINPGGINVAWYQRPLSEHLQSKPADGPSDLQYFVSIRQPVVEVAAEPVPEAIEPIETNEAPDGIENPLTNDVPEAVVLGPADADEKASAPEPEQPLSESEAASEDKVNGSSGDASVPEEGVVEKKEAGAAETEA